MMQDARETTADGLEVTIQQTNEAPADLGDSPVAEEAGDTPREEVTDVESIDIEDRDEPIAEDQDTNETSESGEEWDDVDAKEPVDEAIEADEDTDEADGDDAEAIAEDSEAEADEETEPVEEETATIESVVEAILFAGDEPLTDGRLAAIVETTPKQVRDCIDALNAKYAENHNAFRIEQIAGGYQMLTLSLYNNWLRKMLRARSDSKLSPAAMETLAIIAYKQPVIRADIETIRGVAVGEVIRSLMYKGLVKIVGRAEILGRPMLYGTTKKFLEVFGLNSLRDLPKVEELKKPD